MVNWEATSSDGDRFSKTTDNQNAVKRKGLACFEEYLRRKEERKQKKNFEKIKKAKEKTLRINSSQLN